MEVEWPQKKICPYTNGKVVAKSHSYDIDKPNGTWFWYVDAENSWDKNNC
jgi:hypothetical protein